MAQTKNMTEGKVFPIIFAYFVPILCSTLFQQLYNVIDTIVVGKGINDMALAAVGATGSITFFIFGFIIGLSNGMSVLMAQAYGAGDYKQLRKTITMGALSCGIVGFIIMVASIVAVRPLLVMMNTGKLILDNAVLYLVIILAGIPLMLLYNSFSAILNALGDSKTPLIAVIISTGINIVLDIYFIVGLHMGVDGAAYATLIAQFCSAIFCFVKIRKIPFIHLKKEDWKLDFPLIVAEFKIGIPVAFMNSVTAVGGLILQSYVNKISEHHTAAYAACLKITGFMMNPCSAVGVTMSTYAGQNLGAGRIDRIREGLRKGAGLSLTLAAITGALLIFIPSGLASIMLSDPVNIGLSVDYLRICGLMIWSVSLLFMVRGTCVGMGYTVIPMFSGFMELISRFLVVIFLTPKIGFHAVAIAEVSAWSSAFLLNLVYLIIKLRKLRKKENANKSLM